MSLHEHKIRKNKRKRSNRLTEFLVIVITVFSLLAGRLVYLQLIRGDYYSALAQAMGEKPKTEIAPRGEILDRNLKKLATNKLGYSIIYNSPKNVVTDEEINNSIAQTIEILYKNKEQSKIVSNSLPIAFDADAGKYSYKTTNESKFELLKFARDIKKTNKFTTSFDEEFDYTKLEDFKKRLDSLKDKGSASLDEEIKNFEDNYLANFDPKADARETLFKFAEAYKLITYNEDGERVYLYNLINEERLYSAVSIRHYLKASVYKQYQDIEIAKNVSKETAWEFQVKSNRMVGISSLVVPIRYYPYGELGSAFLGYLGKIDDLAKNKYESFGYDLSRELVGKNNLEYTLENRANNNLGIQLRGEPGVTYVKVDKLGKAIEETATIESVPGDTVVTTINIEMQQAAEKSLEEVMEGIRTGKYSKEGKTFAAYRGAVVAMDINTGEVLALASRPGYNPNDFAETGRPSDPLLLEKYQMTFDSLRKVKEDKYEVIPRPMFNYATQGVAAPGSTFKPFTAIVGLEEGVITKNTKFHDDGLWDNYKDVKINAWNEGKGFGWINVIDALKVSSNYFFNEVGYKLGNEKFGEWAKKFGIARDDLGKKPRTGIEIDESPGVIGTPEEIKRKEATDYLNQIINKLEGSDHGGYSIDKNSIVYTELYNMLMDGIYDENKLDELGITNIEARKYIKGKVNQIDTEAIQASTTEVLYSSMGQGMVSLTPLQMAQFLSTLINGGTRYKAHLVKQVLNSDGTLKMEVIPEVMNKLDLDPDNVKAVIEGMGKVTEEPGGTGRAVFGNYPIRTGGKTGTSQPGDGEIANHRDNYGWYASFAPFDKPEIVVIVAIYDGGHGSYAAYTARAVFDAYFKDDPKIEEWLAKQNK
jgi:penicillin-binding protein 2